VNLKNHECATEKMKDSGKNSELLTPLKCPALKLIFLCEESQNFSTYIRRQMPNDIELG